MATVTPAGTAAPSESSVLNTVVGVIALLAVIALVYFVARGRVSPSVTEKQAPAKPVEQSQPAAPAAKP